MRCQGGHLGSVSNPFRGWTASWTFVSAFYLFLSLVSSIAVNVPGKHPTARTSKPSSVLRRPRRSIRSSRAGFTKYIVSYCPRFAGIDIHQYFFLAVSKWPLFTYDALAASTSTGTTGNEVADNLPDTIFPTPGSSATYLVPEPFAPSPPLKLSATDLAPEPSTPLLTIEPFAMYLAPEPPTPFPTPELSATYLTPNPFTFFPMPELSTTYLASEPSVLPLWPEAPSIPKSTVPTNQSGAIPNQSDATQLVVAIDDLDLTHARPDTTPIQPILTSDQLNAQLPVATTMSVLPRVNTGHPASIPDPARPSSRPVYTPPVTPRHTHSHTTTRPLSPGHEGMPNPGSTPPPNILVGVTDEPMWMKKKRTLNYFRETFKLGDLPSVIRHWYELEGLLGFKDAVSALERIITRLLMTSRPWQDFQRPNAHQSSPYFTSMPTITGGTITLKSRPLVIRSKGGGQKSVLVQRRVFDSGVPQGSIPSLSSCRGGARYSKMNQSNNRLTASVHSRILIASC